MTPVTKQELFEVYQRDMELVVEKDRTYSGSWKKRGGIGAFMVLARKWDRIESMLEKCGYDILDACAMEVINNETTGVMEDVRDLRCYLALVETEVNRMVAQAEAENADS